MKQMKKIILKKTHTIGSKKDYYEDGYINGYINNKEKKN